MIELNNNKAIWSHFEAPHESRLSSKKYVSGSELQNQKIKIRAETLAINSLMSHMLNEMFLLKNKSGHSSNAQYWHLNSVFNQALKYLTTMIVMEEHQKLSALLYLKEFLVLQTNQLKASSKRR